MAGKPRGIPLVERFMEKVEIDPDSGCWNWTGSTHAETGYGSFWRGKITPAGNHCPERAHRVSYELHVGPISEGLQLDHLCRNRRCVNPAHLEPVTNRENALRGIGACAVNARKTHCVHGHEFTAANTIARINGRRCRTCTNLRARQQRRAA